MATETIGVVGTIGLTAGLVQNITFNKNADLAEARDENGDVADAKLYNENEEVSCEWIPDSADTAPAIGDSCVITGGDAVGTYAVTAASLNMSNTDYPRWNVTAKKYSVNTVVPAV